MKISRAVLIAVVLFGTAATCDEPATKFRKLIDHSVDWFEIFPSEESTEPMRHMLALRWPNSVRGSTDGATVFWIANGRPEAVAGIFTKSPRITHEFDSLSRGTIVARRADRIVWDPETPGLTFQPVEGAPAPARFAPARLRQMKALTKQFKATFLGWSASAQAEPLRMLSTPLYRYKIDKPDKVLDGVVFAYASGTDPEALLVIEAYGEEGKYHWEYAFVRRTSGGLQGHYRDEIVWAAKRYPQGGVKKNHIVFKRPLARALELLEEETTDTVDNESTAGSSNDEDQR
jgi:hypothetical protein